MARTFQWCVSRPTHRGRRENDASSTYGIDISVCQLGDLSAFFGTSGVEEDFGLDLRVPDPREALADITRVSDITLERSEGAPECFDLAS